MKLARPLALGAATLFVASSALLAGASASAADFYVDADDFVSEASPYPAQWFIGNGSTGTLSSEVDGLNMDGTTGLIQILNGTPASTTDLGDLVDGADYTLVSGNANFQIPLFTDGAAGSGFTTLRPDNFGPVGLNPLAGWTTSGAFGAFLAGSSHTIPEYEAELARLALTPEILAFGLIAPLAENATVASITWDGNTHWFLPQPTAAVSADTITVSQFAASGVTATFTGFIPGETIDFGYGNGGSGGSFATGVAAADGSATVTFTNASTSTAAGVTYSLSAIGATSNAFAGVTFDLVADPAVAAVPPVPAADELAYGGTDAMPAVVGAATLLLLGAAAVVATRVRRRSATA
jgi:hypothetical protein